MATNAREFFDNIVKPAYEAWQGDPLIEWKMNAAIAALNNMAEWVLGEWGEGRVEVFGASGRSAAHDYRTALTQHECRDFALVRDIADGHKHVTIDRTTRLVSGADQVEVEDADGGFDSEAFDSGFDIGGDQFVVTLDDGTKRRVRDIAEDVFDMWERLLTRWGM